MYYILYNVRCVLYLTVFFYFIPFLNSNMYMLPCMSCTYIYLTTLYYNKPYYTKFFVGLATLVGYAVFNL